MTEDNHCLKKNRLSSGYDLELWLIQTSRMTTHGTEFQIYVCDPSEPDSDERVVVMPLDTTDYNDAIDLYENLLEIDRLPKKVWPVVDPEVP